MGPLTWTGPSTISASKTMLFIGVLIKKPPWIPSGPGRSPEIPPKNGFRPLPVISRTEPQLPAMAGGMTQTVRALSPACPAGALALAAALPVFFAMALLLRIGPMTDPASGGLEPGVRTKGLEPRIFIYRDMGDGDIELLQNNDAVRANDTLQISYLATGQNYGAILSIDGSSVITLHYPENSNMLPRLQPQDEVYLPYGYLLDDAPDFERFIFVTSEEAFDVRQLMASIAPQLRGSAWLDQGMLEFPKILMSTG
jgi:hypothetical protein